MTQEMAYITAVQHDRQLISAPKHALLMSEFESASQCLSERYE